MCKKNKIIMMGQALKTVMIKHSPEIMTGVGIAGMITTTALAVKATPKAMELMEEKKYIEKSEKLSKVEIVKTTWKCYIPSMITGTFSIVCLVGANSVNSKRNTALAAAYSLSESALREYKTKVVETVGERKEQTVRDAIAKEKIVNNPVVSKEVIVTGKGETLCFDVVSGRYFRSDIEKLRKAENFLNRQMRDDMYISLNELYLEIGIEPISIGDDLGWNIDEGYIDLDFSSQLTEDGTPCLVVSYRIAPRYDFTKG